MQRRLVGEVASRHHVDGDAPRPEARNARGVGARRDGADDPRRKLAPLDALEQVQRRPTTPPESSTEMGDAAVRTRRPDAALRDAPGLRNVHGGRRDRTSNTCTTLTLGEELKESPAPPRSPRPGRAPASSPCRRSNRSDSTGTSTFTLERPVESVPRPESPRLADMHRRPEVDWSMATVTQRCSPCFLASMRPARSMAEGMTPQKTVPYWFDVLAEAS
ncbi:MAG: hypothetical protein U0575_16990 [Phycisphaerales bacterium]